MLINQKTKHMNCLNCDTKLTCGCQKKLASDKKQVCTSCVQVYERKLKEKKEQALNNLKKP